MTESVILEQKTVQSAPGSGIQARRQRLYIFPTRHGLIYAIMLAVMLLGAVNYTNNMAYMLTFMLGSLFMVCMLHTYRNMHGLVVVISEARAVFAGDIARFPVVFDNRKGQRRININVDLWPAQWNSSRIAGTGICNARIAQGQMYRDFLPVPAPARGYLRPGRMKIHSVFPLGLFQSWSYLQGSSSCLVYPRPQGDPRLPGLTEDSSHDQSGELSGTDDFTGFRHYRAGDSIRNIDWKIYAREQGLLVKKFSGSGARKLVLHWDRTAQLQDIESRLSQLTLWVLQAEQGGLRYGLVLPGIQLDISHGEAHQHTCLRELALYGKDTHN